MKIYLVGGAVRDKLLGLPIKERDWVVVGATTKDMLHLGYKQVGKEFPVFLHPETREEYALARQERKVKPGYQGFTFDTSQNVTLKDDLKRRDLTINAMAETPEGKLTDPYHGKEDLEQKILRHVSDAFVEDPVRILRVGRFLARFAHQGFRVAPETVMLMKKMVASGEVDALVAERVWKELERALAEKNPEKFFEVLSECGALSVLFPHLTINGPGMSALMAASTFTHSPAIRFAALLHALPEDNDNKSEAKKIISALCHRYRVPNAYSELAQLIAAHCEEALSARKLSAEKLLKLFAAVDIFRRFERFNHFLQATDAIAKSRKLIFDSQWLKKCAEQTKSIDVQQLINQGITGNKLPPVLKEKRLKIIEDWIEKTGPFFE